MSESRALFRRVCTSAPRKAEIRVHERALDLEGVTR